MKRNSFLAILLASTLFLNAGSISYASSSLDASLEGDDIIVESSLEASSEDSSVEASSDSSSTESPVEETDDPTNTDTIEPDNPSLNNTGNNNDESDPAKEGNPDDPYGDDDDDDESGTDDSSEASSEDSSEDELLEDEESEDASLASLEEEELPEFYYDTFPTGVIGGSESVESITDGRVQRRALLKSSYVPESYKNENLPDLRNQSPYGSCWAFASTALAEINLMHQGIMSSPDLSELHLAYFTYHWVDDPLNGFGDFSQPDSISRILNVGGNIDWGFDTYSRWVGVADESTANYVSMGSTANSTGLDESIAYDDVVHIKNWYAQPIDVDDLSPVKQLILDYGAVGINFYAYNSISGATNSSVYKAATNSYYNPDAQVVNHAVTVVGWDDNYSKDNFQETPPGDGAWLVRNSWYRGGSEESYLGYFWMSYYEATLGDNAYAGEFTLAGQYDNNYQYDQTIGHGLMSIEQAANVFTAHGNSSGLGETIEAVSFYTKNSTVSYKISIYTDLTDPSDPTSGTLAIEPYEGVTGYAGYQTIELPEEYQVYVSQGETFSVLIDLSGNSDYIYLGSERSINIGGSTFNPACDEGQSFYKFRNSNIWNDCGALGRKNIIIKAFTTNEIDPNYVAAEDISFSEIEGDILELGVGASEKINATVLPENATVTTITWTSSDESVATINSFGQVNTLKLGTTIITATSGKISRSFTLNVVEKLNAVGIGFSLSNGHSYIPGIKFSCYVRPNPSTYILKSKATWSSSDPTIIQIDPATGKGTMLKPGVAAISVNADGVIGTIHLFVVPQSGYYTPSVSDDNVITFTWDSIPGVDSYKILETETGKVLKEYTPGDEDECSVDITNYQGEEPFGEIELSIQAHSSLTTPATATVTLTVKSKNRITYDVGEGTQNSENPKAYYDGEELALYEPEAPIGKYFAGWFVDNNSNRKVTAITADLSGDLLLVARYSPIKYTVSFNSNGGTSIIDRTAYYDRKLSTPEHPVKSGYSFENWYLDQSLTTVYDINKTINENVGLNTDVTLYAKWTLLPDSVEIIPSVSDYELSAGDIVMLDYEVHPEGTTLDLDWEFVFTPSDCAVSSLVGDQYKLLAVKPGFVTVTASGTDGTEGRAISDSVSFAIKDVYPQSVSLVVQEDVIEDGKSIITLGSLSTTRVVEATILPENTSDKNITWESSDEAIATVSFDENNNSVATVTAHQEGTVFIYAISQKDEAIRASHMFVVKGPKEDEAAGKATELRILSTDKTPKFYASSSDDPTLTLYGPIADDSPAQTDLVKSELQIAVGKSASLKADFLPKQEKISGKKVSYVDSVIDKTVIWASGNSAIATVANGKVTAKSAGTTVIYLMSNDRNLIATCRVTVYDPVTTLTLDKTSLKLGMNQEATISVATILPATANDEVEFTVPDNQQILEKIKDSNNVCTVRSNGVKGTVKVTARAKQSGKTATCTVQVGNAVESMILSGKNGATDVAAGKSLQLAVTFNPLENGKADSRNQPINKNVTYEILNDTGVATVNAKGVLTGLQYGKVTVKATSTTDIDPNTGELCSDTAEFNVYMPLKSSSISAKSVTMVPGGSYDLKVNLVSALGADVHVTGSSIDIENLYEDIKWSSNSKYINYDDHEDGSCTITDVYPGALPKNGITATITASFRPYGAKKDTKLTCKVTVKSQAISSFTVTPSSISMNRDEIKEIAVTFNPMVPVDDKIIWTIDTEYKNDICFVDDHGNAYDNDSFESEGNNPSENKIKIQAIDNGERGKRTAKILATTSGTNSKGKHLSKTIKITIGEKASSIEIKPFNKDNTLVIKKSGTLKATVYSDDDNGKKVKAGNQKVTWSSSDESIATVTSSGKVTGVGNGRVTITAKNETGPEKTIDITVYTTASKLSLDKTKVAMSTAVTDKEGTRTTSYNQFNAVTPNVLSDDIFNNFDSCEDAAPEDTSFTGKNCVIWKVSGTGSIKVAAVKTTHLQAAKDIYDKQNLLKELVYEDITSEGFKTRKGESLAFEAKGPGTVKLTASVPGKKATCNVTIYTHVQDVAFAPVKINNEMFDPDTEMLNLKVKGGTKTVTLKPQIDYYDAPFSDTKGTPETAAYNIARKYSLNNNITYISSDSSVATVNAKGLITAKKAGVAIIKAVSADGNVQKIIEVTVE